MEFTTIYNVSVTSSLICLVIDFKMVLMAYCNQRIIQPYFEWRISNCRGFRVAKQAVWAAIQKYKTHGMISHLPKSGRPFKLTREMLDAIEERMKQDEETQLVKMLGKCGFKIFTHPLRNCNRAQL